MKLTKFDLAGFAQRGLERCDREIESMSSSERDILPILNAYKCLAMGAADSLSHYTARAEHEEQMLVEARRRRHLAARARSLFRLLIATTTICHRFVAWGTKLLIRIYS